MGTIKDEMEKVGFELSKDESKKVKNSLASMKRKFRRATCRKCGGDIQFIEVDKKMIPHDPEGEIHWKTCSYSPFAQKKDALIIIKKLAVYFVIRHGIDIDSEVGLSQKEAQIVHAILERAFKEPKLKTSETVGEILSEPTEDDVKTDLQVVESAAEESKSTVSGDDPIGDPDEDLAPSEEAIEAEESVEAEESTEKISN